MWSTRPWLLTVMVVVLAFTAGLQRPRKSLWGESCASSADCEDDFACDQQVCRPSDGKHARVDPDGTRVEGRFHRGLLVDGRAVATDGTRSIGRFVNGELIEGEMYLPDNRHMTGTFKGGTLVEGTVSDDQGNRWKGEFRDGRLWKGHLWSGPSGQSSGTIEDGELERGTVGGSSSRRTGRGCARDSSQAARWDTRSRICPTVRFGRETTKPAWRSGDGSRPGTEAFE